jgi:hypothetical protein
MQFGKKSWTHFYIIIFWVTNQLTSWSRVHLKRLTTVLLVKKFPVLYGSQRVITMFTSFYAIWSLLPQWDGPSKFSKLPVIQQWGVPVTWICSLHGKNYRNPVDRSQISDTYCHALVTRHRFGLINGFVEILQLVITRNYNTVTNLHTLQFTVAHANSSQFSSLVTARLWLSFHVQRLLSSLAGDSHS